jgi:hypothetical protein
VLASIWFSRPAHTGTLPSACQISASGCGDEKIEHEFDLLELVELSERATSDTVA